MSEKFPSTNHPEFNSDEREICLEYAGYVGMARLAQCDQDVTSWQITILAGNQVICVAEIDGDDENIKNEIQTMINQFLWDPMSQA